MAIVSAASAAERALTALQSHPLGTERADHRACDAAASTHGGDAHAIWHYADCGYARGRSIAADLLRWCRVLAVQAARVTG